MRTSDTGSDIAAAILAAFQDRAAQLGVDVQRVATLNSAIPLITSATRTTRAGTIFVTAELLEAAPALAAAIEAEGLDWAVAGAPDRTNDAPLGLSLAHLAVAETASVLLAEPSLEDRGIGLLVGTQIVICPTSALRPSLDDAAPVLRELALRPGGAYTTLVTGPSRTADIERVLTVGVQGPAKVIVLFVDTLT